VTKPERRGSNCTAAASLAVEPTEQRAAVVDEEEGQGK
jgi:hypothetical protein